MSRQFALSTAIFLAGAISGAAIGENVRAVQFLHGVPREQALASIVWTRDICTSKDRYVGWPTVCRRKNGELVAVFSGDREGRRARERYAAHARYRRGRAFECDADLHQRE